MNNTVASTNSLKGIAILIVLINHYLNLNVSGNSAGFANLWIAIFFMLSGYGIEHSLEKTFNNGTQQTARLYFRFYYSRLIRIFPLFLVAYLTECFLFGNNISVFTVLGLKAPGHYWFIPAIIQCYALAPFVHISIKKNRFLMLTFLLSTFVLTNIYLYSTYAPVLIVNLLKDVHLNWRNIFFLYLFLFLLSMFIPKIEHGWNRISTKEKILYYFSFIGLIFLTMICVKYNTILPKLYTLTISTIYPLLLIIVSTIYFTFSKIRIPIISFIGEYSYSIYLFHMTFYLLINKYLSYGKDSTIELVVITLLFTPFVFFCKSIEIFVNALAKYLKFRKIFAQQNA